MHVGDVPDRMARRRNCAELVLDDFSVGDQVIGFYCIRRSFLQQSTEQYQNALFRHMPAEPSTNAMGSCLSGEREPVAGMIVDAHTEFVLEERCSSGMIVVPVSEKNGFQSILRDTYFLKAVEEVRRLRVHAHINREESAEPLNNIRTREIRGPAKAPHALGDRDVFEFNVRLS